MSIPIDLIGGRGSISRWADVEDSDSETESPLILTKRNSAPSQTASTVSEPGPNLTVREKVPPVQRKTWAPVERPKPFNILSQDDSYQGPPVKGLDDDSKTGLNKLLSNTRIDKKEEKIERRGAIKKTDLTLGTFIKHVDKKKTSGRTSTLVNKTTIKNSNQQQIVPEVAVPKPIVPVEKFEDDEFIDRPKPTSYAAAARLAVPAHPPIIEENVKVESMEIDQTGPTNFAAFNATWKPNVDAREFVPMVFDPTFACQQMPMNGKNWKAKNLGKRKSRKSTESGTSTQKGKKTVTENNEVPDVESFNSLRPARKKNRKSQNQKTTDGAGQTNEQQPKKEKRSPESFLLTQEQLNHRAQTRLQDQQKWQQSEVYKTFLQMYTEEQRKDLVMEPPNPLDLNLSKRSFKFAWENWTTQIKKLVSGSATPVPSAAASLAGSRRSSALPLEATSDGGVETAQ